MLICHVVKPINGLLRATEPWLRATSLLLATEQSRAIANSNPTLVITALDRRCFWRRDGVSESIQSSVDLLYSYLTILPLLPSPPASSDAFEMTEVDDIVYELDAAMIIVSDGDVDIGGNPSAEEAQDALDNGASQVINIVHSFRLQQTQFDKKSYLSHLKVGRTVEAT